MLVSVAALGLALSYRSADQKRLDEARLRNCLAIEELKAAEREQALQSFRSLDRTLRVLGLPKTPQIVRISRENRDATLERFAPREC